MLAEPKTYLVTGANSGIGKETTVALAAKGGRVIMLCRNPDKGAAALAEVRERTGSERIELLQADLADLDSLDRVVETIKARFGDLDVLINNAGLYVAGHHLDARGWETHWAVNHLGPAYLTRRLIDTLDVGPRRIINVSSMAHRFARLNLDDPFFERRPFVAFQAYADTKLANLLFTAGLRQHHPEIASYAVHPGMIATNLSHSDPGVFSFFAKLSRPLLQSPAEGAETSVWLATDDDIPESRGFYYADSKPRTPSRTARARHQIDALWAWTMRMFENV